ncbi:MAG: 4-hydroxy-3-methylbut-2-en-1-yl diphosphate synthase [Verrucomicrobia bacterium]|nr:MAG: 4-hydroxy-3-methylbut-2-en-1-yl diphosphate synthase [Verrucomicrobiota bacterium]
MNSYCESRFECVRSPSRAVDVGGVQIGGGAPIVVQSMTNTKTQDVEASVRQCIQLAEAGCQIIRLTAQNLEAARALGEISRKLRAAGLRVPLAADIHFLPATAMEAVEHVEKIRVNPGNFTDKKLAKTSDYTDSEYAAELEKVREKFAPLVLRCKELGRAIRIGVNHGSLSDRIIRRYGDTSYGMAEAAFEFARICDDLGFKNYLFSFKASNTRIMTHAYRLASQMMRREGFNAPLHLGVTEAGFGLDARIKSAMGIGGLLLDGIGDTIRVSLTEDPVEEIPVARDIAAMIDAVRAKRPGNLREIDEKIDFYSYSKRESATLSCGGLKIGGGAVPAVAAFGKSESADITFDADGGTSRDGGIMDIVRPRTPQELESALKGARGATAAEIENDNIAHFSDLLKAAPQTVLIAPAPKSGRHAVGEARLLAANLKALGLKNPIWLKFDGSKMSGKSAAELSKLNEASVYIGSLMCDGIGDMASVEIAPDAEKNAAYALAILQGARARRSKAEYIACPSCGRTLYNIQEAAAKIQAATSHLKDITIAVMGCVVNGPGEMADADFGYVGGAPGKISLYKNKKCVEMNIPQEESIEKLIALIKAEGKWTDPS